MIDHVEEVQTSPLGTANQNLRDDKKLTRKRQVHREAWKQNVRKRKREGGMPYEDIKGKAHRERSVQGQCGKVQCRLKCAAKINYVDQSNIHKKFWTLSDARKSEFYNKFIERVEKQRCRPRMLPAPNAENAFKKFSLKYYLQIGEEKIKVCKSFFINTLDISARRISYFFEKNNIDESFGTTISPKRGRHAKRVTPNLKLEEVRNHINSFPRVESHYCRASTNKEYLESKLNITKMHKLYCELFPDPVKINVYRKIFETEFNIAFHKPKKDRCDTCEEFKQSPPTSEEEVLREALHKKSKTECKTEKDTDKRISCDSTMILSFDLENVFLLPKANVSNFFYRRKLAVYNLTGYCSLNKKNLLRYLE